MTGFRLLLIASLLGTHAPLAHTEGSQSGLRHDPFARPDLALAPAAAAQSAEPAPKEWKPQLRAVIVAGKSSLVNVEGTIVPLGGQIDGYRLTRVEDRTAVFMKNGERVELTMSGERANQR